MNPFCDSEAKLIYKIRCCSRNCSCHVHCIPEPQTTAHSTRCRTEVNTVRFVKKRGKGNLELRLVLRVFGSLYLP